MYNHISTGFWLKYYYKRSFFLILDGGIHKSVFFLFYKSPVKGSGTWGPLEGNVRVILGEWKIRRKLQVSGKEKSKLHCSLRFRLKGQGNNWQYKMACRGYWYTYLDLLSLPSLPCGISSRLVQGLIKGLMGTPLPQIGNPRTPRI